MSNPISRLFSLLGVSVTVMGVRNSKEAGYRALSDDGNIQIRLYQPMLVAETEIEADYSQAGKIGFNRLAGYIFGGNERKQEIAMTTPVFRTAVGPNETLHTAIQSTSEINHWIMSFVMPAKFALKTLPQPSDSLVMLKSIPAKKVATLRYSGSLNQARIIEYSQILIAWLDERDIKRLSSPKSAAYDPPWTIPSLRRNEIHIDIE